MPAADAAAPARRPRRPVGRFAVGRREWSRRLHRCWDLARGRARRRRGPDGIGRGRVGPGDPGVEEPGRGPRGQGPAVPAAPARHDRHAGRSEQRPGHPHNGQPGRPPAPRLAPPGPDAPRRRVRRRPPPPGARSAPRHRGQAAAGELARGVLSRTASSVRAWQPRRAGPARTRSVARRVVVRTLVHQMELPTVRCGADPDESPPVGGKALSSNPRPFQGVEDAAAAEGDDQDEVLGQGIHGTAASGARCRWRTRREDGFGHSVPRLAPLESPGGDEAGRPRRSASVRGESLLPRSRRRHGGAPTG
jgi:hypothetical protein